MAKHIIKSSASTPTISMSRDLANTAHQGATDSEPRWYAIYTLPRHEKTVADRLFAYDLRSYLPLYSANRLWNHRRVEVELPLFPGYVFVYMHIRNKVKVLRCTGVIRLVSVNSVAVAIPDGEIERLQSSLAACRAEPYPSEVSGKQVRVKSGPFAGLEGVIVRRRGRTRLVVSLDLIQSAIVLHIDASDALLAS